MRKYGLSIDPGISNGACLFSWDEDEPFKQEALYQFGGGAQGLADFIESQDIVVNRTAGAWFNGATPLDRIVVEKFTPRNNSSFALTQDSVEPLRGEGVLIGHGFGPFITWQSPAMQYFMGGIDLKEKKKRSREFLKLHGLYATGKTVGQKNADDAISAELHAIAAMRKMRHMPTLIELFQDEGDES